MAARTERSRTASRLVRTPRHGAAEDPGVDPQAAAVLRHGGGFLRVLGGPGTGKTNLLAELAAQAMREQAGDGEPVLVLTASRRAAANLRSAITARCAQAAAGTGAVTVREPLVRTVHSYAFGVLRRQAALQGSPTPRLLSGPEQDAVVRELLAGDIAAGAHHWPAELRGALGLPGFAAELRDLLLRAAERGVGPEQLAKLGRMHRRPQWVAAGRFGAQYEQVTLLQGGGIGGAGAPALDAAELVASALLALHTDAELLATERRRVRRVYLDDAQHLDPLQWRLVRALGDAAGEFVVFGDPDQSIFSFRGADPRLLTDADPGGERTVVLSTEHRMSEAVRGAVLRLASRLPGSSPSRTLRAPLDREHVRHGRLDIRVFAGEAAQAAWLADELRRAHLLTGMRYAEMAVLVRSVPRSVAVLRRAMLAAGVPVAVSAAELPPARHAAVAPLLEVLRVAEDPARLDEDSAELLLGSALGGSDPLQQRRLRRELRRLELAGGGARSSGELLVEALRGGDALVALGETTAAGLRGLIELIRVTSDALPDGLQQGLWRLWQASGLEDRWVSLALRGGYLGAQADRDLDAVVALFEAANRYAERLPGAAVAEFVESLADQQFAADTLAPRAPGGDAVSILSAHAAAGREWSLVALAGVTEGSWPDLRLRGSLLGVEALVDILDGIEGQDTVSATAPLLAEERRLLLVAASRAREVLLIGAVRDEQQAPSRFLDELSDAAAGANDAPEWPLYTPRRALVLAELVGELRRAVTDPKADPALRGQAARQLARLAQAGVPGAHPRGWYGLAEVSSSAELLGAAETIVVTPSTVDTLMTCPLRWVLQRHGADELPELPAVSGSLVHALLQAVSTGAAPEEVDAAFERAWSGVDAGAPWFSRREASRLRGMLATFSSWLAATRTELTQVALEHQIEAALPAEIEGTQAPGPVSARPITVRGRVDRLERDDQGRPVVVDIKTGKVAVSAKDGIEHPQLAVYQLAALLGAFREVLANPEPGGARLLYVAQPRVATGANERAQPPLRGEAAAQWLAGVRSAALAALGPVFVARENTECPRCPVRTSCPVQETGRQVGQ